MTVHSAYHYTCDSTDCDATSPNSDNSYSLPDRWTSVVTGVKTGTGTTSRHLCPNCTDALEGLMSGRNAVKLDEEYFR